MKFCGIDLQSSNSAVLVTNASLGQLTARARGIDSYPNG